MLALLSGLGGGNFASSMSNINFFFPKNQQGLALGNDPHAFSIIGDCQNVSDYFMADYAQAHQQQLRPHTKTHKSLHVARRQLDAGAIGFSVASNGSITVSLPAGSVASRSSRS